MALDWWNGNRSILVDTDLSGLLIGASLATRPGRHLSGTARSQQRTGHARSSTRSKRPAIAVDRIVACGGLPDRSQLLMQLTADITGREVDVAASTQAPAVGSAMYAAVAAGPGGGGYESIESGGSRDGTAPRSDVSARIRAQRPSTSGSRRNTASSTTTSGAA